MRFLILFISLWAFSASSSMKMVVSNRPIFDILNQVKTDDLEIQLIAQNSHSHSTELLPKDKVLVNESDILLAIEPFDISLIKAAKQLNKEIIILNELSEHILPVRRRGHDKHGHEEERIDDPHFWLSPLVVRDIIEYLSQKDPLFINELKYSLFIKKINDYKKMVRKDTQPYWIVYHDGWQYLESYFGFDAPQFFTQNPKGLIRPDDYKNMREQLKELYIKCIIIEPQTVKQVALRMKKILQIEAILLDPTGRTAPKDTNSLYWIWDEYIKAAEYCSD